MFHNNLFILFFPIGDSSNIISILIVFEYSMHSDVDRSFLLLEYTATTLIIIIIITLEFYIITLIFNNFLVHRF